MHISKKIDLKATRWVSNSSPSIYNAARVIRCLIDKVNINYAAYKKKPFVLIYQQGRVASKSVYESLCAINLSNPIYHIHTLSVERSTRKIAEASKNKTRIDRNLFVGKMLGKAIKRIVINNSYQPWKIICIFRDPISIMISLNFMHVASSFSNVIEENGNLDKRVAVEYFVNLFNNDDPSGWSVCNWFDEYFKEELGIDVYLHPFNTISGYTIIEDPKFNILLLRFENLAHAFKYGCSELLNLEHECLNLLHSNVHKDDRYSDVHQYVKQYLKLPRSICEKVYSTKFVKHFYSSKDIEMLIHRWVKPN